MLTKEKKQEIVTKFGQSAQDSGSPEVQVALLTHRIQYLTEHFANHKQDFHSKRGMMKLIGQRKSFLNYIKKQSPERYLKLIGELGLRK